MLSRPATSRRHVRVVTAAAILTALSVPLASESVSAAPTVSTGGPFTYLEQDPPKNIGTGTVVSGSNFYDGKYIDFQITGGTADENLALESASTASTVDGVVSVVGSAV